MTAGRITLLHKGLLLIGLPLLYQAIFIAVLLKRQHAYNEAQAAAVRGRDVISRVEHVYRMLLEEQSAQRAYVLIGDRTLLPQGVQERFEELVAELRRDVAENPHQAGELDLIDKLAHERFAWARETLRLVEVGRREDAIARIAQGDGMKLMSQVRDHVERFRREEERLYAARREQLNRQSIVQTELLIGGLFMNVAMSLAAVFYFGREISRRLGVLTDNVGRFARNEPLAPSSGGSDEIAVLDRSFHLMASDLQLAREREQEVQNTLQQRHSELQQVNRELDQKRQENEMFVYSVSHDLRSPLVNLQGFSKELDLVREELRNLLQGELTFQERERARHLVDTDVKESLHFIQSGVTRLSTIIDALLRLSRAGRVEYHPELLNLEPIVARIVAAMNSAITQRQAEIIVRDLPPAYADPTAAEQIFANLIGNAVNYLHPERPGSIEVGALPQPFSEDDQLQIFYVKDNGMGIADAYLPKVFAVFQRLHSKAAPGEGIGLALVRRIVERHGGRVWVESQEDAGSTFFVSLPRRAPGADAHSAEGKADDPEEKPVGEPVCGS
jgi:signal transduction histidine kinase